MSGVQCNNECQYDEVTRNQLKSYLQCIHSLLYACTIMIKIILLYSNILLSTLEIFENDIVIDQILTSKDLERDLVCTFVLCTWYPSRDLEESKIRSRSRQASSSAIISTYFIETKLNNIRIISSQRSHRMQT